VAVTMIGVIVPSTHAEEIPSWIKNTAGWWADGNVRDNDFVNGIGFLIKNGIISLPIIESTEGVSEKNILNLLQDTWPNEFHEISFSGIVVPRPVMPIDVTLIDPDGIITKSETYADGEGNYSIIFKFDRNSKTGIYHVNMHHWDKLVNSDSFKLEKFSVKTKIPTWIKNNAGWWADGTIDNDAFIQGIQYLVKNRILIVEDNSISSSNEKNLPSSKYKETHIEGFPDPLKTPKYYLDRYYGEENYRKWFDEQFTNITIYEILGLISNSDEIIKYIVPSSEFSKSYGIDKHKTKYLNELTSSELVTGIETNYSTKSGNVGITIYKMSTQNFANELFNSLSKDTDLNSMSQFEKYYFQEVICLAERLSPQICVYDKYLIFTDLYWGSTGDPDRKIGIIIVDKTLQNISMIENKNYESQITPISVNWDNQSVLSLFTPFTDMGIVNLGMMSDPTNSDLEPEVKSTEGFHGLYCQQDEYGYVEMTGQYTNGPEAYSSIYFKFGVLDYQDRIVSTGIGVVSNIAPYQTKMFDASAEWSGNFKECIIEVDTAFP
jgi:hypothetical protein